MSCGVYHQSRISQMPQSSDIVLQVRDLSTPKSCYSLGDQSATDSMILINHTTSEDSPRSETIGAHWRRSFEPVRSEGLAPNPRGWGITISILDLPWQFQCRATRECSLVIASAWPETLHRFVRLPGHNVYVTLL
ncbi:hypothetical protein RRG08_012854 [Elysia crispata]|uniref:Uncharacterized protein n=1 Tax=Elysia crispata TaxID=231223 RepID=A0AAE1B7G2_9GAST|nr:hypothetical protein RRG08_012854 [Elysia crispata]